MPFGKCLAVTRSGTMSNNKGNKVLYVGNYTIDIAVRDGVRYEKDKESFFVKANDGSEIEVCEDPARRKTTDKNDCLRNLEFMLGQVPTAVEKLGGGGRNSLAEHVLIESTGQDTIYLDMQVPCESILRYMKQNRVESYFLNKRRPAVNVVVGGRDNKRIIKSPIEKNLPLTSIEAYFISAMVKSSGRVLMNSAKDMSLADCVMQHCRRYKKEVGVVVTTSFDNYDYVRGHIVPSATCIFNYDEIGTVFNPEHKSLGDENDKNEDALWGIGDCLAIQMRSGQRHSIYVTLGKNGIFAADRHGEVYHIFLRNEEIRQSLAEIIPKREDATNGCGDHFAAAALKYEEQGYQTIAAGILGQIHSIRFIGYRGDISESDFIVQPVDKRLLQRKQFLRYAA